MRKILALLVFIVSILAACYVGGTLTALMVGTTIVKCMFAGIVAIVIFLVGSLASTMLKH